MSRNKKKVKISRDQPLQPLQPLQSKLETATITDPDQVVENFTLSDARRVLIKWYGCEVSRTFLTRLAMESEISYCFKKNYLFGHTSGPFFIWSIKKTCLETIANFIKLTKARSREKRLKNLKQYRDTKNKEKALEDLLLIN